MRDVRIQKVLAEQGICSRRAAEQLIREGRVKLNGRPVTVGDKMDTLKDLLTVDGQKVYVPKKSEKYYYMMYKPRGYITTTNDERGRKTVMDLITDVPVRVYPVGRLDKDSEGLLLLTNDGDFAVPRDGAPPRNRGADHCADGRRCAGRRKQNAARCHPCGDRRTGADSAGNDHP